MILLSVRSYPALLEFVCRYSPTRFRKNKKRRWKAVLLTLLVASFNIVLSSHWSAILRETYRHCLDIRKQKFSCTINSNKTCTACPYQWKTHISKIQKRTLLALNKNSLLMSVKSLDSLAIWVFQGMLFAVTPFVTWMTSLTRKQLSLGHCAL